MEYSELTTRPNRFLALTGHTIEEFDALFPYFEDAHQRYLSKYLVNGKARTGPRKFTLYRNSPLPGIRERLIFILLYLKTNPIQEVHAEMFKIEQKQCNEFVHCFKKILDMALADMDVVADADLARHDDVVARRSAAGDADLCGEQVVTTDAAVVPDLHEVVDLGAVADLRRAVDAAIDR